MWEGGARSGSQFPAEGMGRVGGSALIAKQILVWSSSQIRPTSLGGIRFSVPVAFLLQTAHERESAFVDASRSNP